MSDTTAELFCFPGQGERDPSVILELAKKDCKSVVIIGIDGDGEFFMSSSIGEWPDIAWLLKKADWFIQDQLR